MNSGVFPLTYEIQRQEEYSRFLPLVKWLLLIPHWIILIFLFFGVFFSIVISFFAVLITANYPRGLFDFVVGVTRWTVRVYAYGALMTDSYPPFSLADDPSHPVRFDIAYPEQGVDRWRPLVHWILIIPYHFIASLLAYVAPVISFFAFFTILFTKQFPKGMFEIALNAMRWTARSNAYLYWMVTQYPPFEWEPPQPGDPQGLPPAPTEVQMPPSAQAPTQVQPPAPPPPPQG